MVNAEFKCTATRGKDLTSQQLTNPVSGLVFCQAFTRKYDISVRQSCLWKDFRTVAVMS